MGRNGRLGACQVVEFRPAFIRNESAWRVSGMERIEVIVQAIAHRSRNFTTWHEVIPWGV